MTSSGSNNSLGAGGGGQAGEIVRLRIFLIAGVAISYIVGSPGLRATSANTTPGGADAGRNVGFGTHAIDTQGGQGAKGAGNGQPTGFGYGGGGGGAGGSVSMTSYPGYGLAGRGSDGGSDGSNGGTVPTTVVYGGNGGSGVIIIEWDE